MKVRWAGVEESHDATLKQEANELIDLPPADASCDYLIDAACVPQAILAGLQDSNADRVTAVAEVRRSYGLCD